MDNNIQSGTPREAAFTISPFEPSETEAVTALWRESMKQAIGIPPVHSFDSQAYFLREILPQDHQIWVAREAVTGAPIGFMAANERCISQLYIHVDYQHRGIGSALMAIAKRDSTGCLQLRTFEVNQNAQQFYERHGFRAIGGDNNNEEGLPDILYVWEAENC